MSDFSLLYKEYHDFISTFKKTSLDNHDINKSNEYLCMDETKEVINFDKIIEKEYPDSNNRPKSFDAIYFDTEIDNNKVYLIEFKNQKNPKLKDIEGKLLYGKQELDNLLVNLGINKEEYKFIFCLVYNQYKPTYARYKRSLSKSIFFECLNKHKNKNIVSDIFIEDVGFYTEQFRNSDTLKCG